MCALDATRIVATWELGRPRHPLDRALLLFALAEPEADPDALADRPLSARNAALLRLRQTQHGNLLDAWRDCPHCGARLEFRLDLATLLADYTPAPARVDLDGLAVRPPTSRDLALITRQPDPEQAALALLKRCLLTAPEGPPPDLAARLPQLEATLEAADPLSALVLDFHCEVCGQRWADALDIPALLWEEIEAGARRLLDQVHLLAGAYGWREGDILALSDARRAAYIERVLA